MKKLIIISALLVGVSAAALPAGSMAMAQSTKSVQSSPDDQEKQVLVELLQEMRELRIALQHMQSVSQRTQVTLEQIRLQQNRVDSISRTLENLRTHLADISAARPAVEDDMREMN